jgi:hypothetical protein
MPEHEEPWLANKASFRRKPFGLLRAMSLVEWPESRNVRDAWIPNRVRDDYEKKMHESGIRSYSLKENENEMD